MLNRVPEARANLVSNQVELAWLNRYMLPNKIIVDSGNKLLAELKFMMANDFRIHATPSVCRI